MLRNSKIFVLGANGMLGKYVYRYLKNQGYDVVGTTRVFGYDARDFLYSSLPQQLEELSNKIVYIINCIGVIKQRNIESEQMFAVNGSFPMLLANFLTGYKNTRLIHVSTDCVFSGNTQDFYHEYSPRDACDLYGQSKIIGEEAYKYGNCNIVRTSIIGEDKRSSLSLLEWVRSQNHSIISGYTNHWWNGVTCLQLAKLFARQIDQFNSFPDLVNYTSPSVVSKYDLVKKIRDCYDLDIQVVATGTKRAVNRHLHSLHASDLAEHQPPSIDVQLKEQFEFKDADDAKPFQSQSAEAPDGVP